MIHAILITALWLVLICAVLGIVYAALSGLPLLQPYLPYLRATFLIIIALVLLDLLVGGGTFCGASGLLGNERL